MEEKLYSSTASGYLILAKLKDSTQHFAVGFPGEEQQYNFYCTINHKDHGFIIKNFGASGWGLYDLQTLGIQTASQMSAGYSDGVVKIERNDSNPFTDLLSKAANDTTLNQKVIYLEKEPPAVKIEEKKPVDTLLAVQDPVVLTAAEGQKIQPPKTDSAAHQPKPVEVVSQAPPLQQITEKPPVDSPSVKEVPVVSSGLKEIKEENPVMDSTKTDLKLPQVVTQAKPDKPATEVPLKEPEDTVVKKAMDAPVEAIILQEKKAVDYIPSKVTRRSESLTTEGMGVVYIDEFPDGKKDTIRILVSKPAVPFTEEKPVKKEEKSEELRFLDISMTVKPKDSVAGKEAEPVKEIQACPQIAGETDFLLLRRDMASQMTARDMIRTADKAFRLKCYTTEQIKNLGHLFLSDSGKLDFYKTAVGYCSDRENLGQLESELTGPDFKREFRQLIKNK